MSRLKPSERRLVAVGGLVAVLAAVWLAVVAPVLGGFSARADERTALLQAYRRNLRLLDGIPTWRRQAQAQRRTAAAYAIAAPSLDEAQDLLKQQVSQAIVDAGGTISAAQPLQGTLPQGWIGVRADLQVTLSGLQTIVTRLEDAQPYVVVEYLSIAADRAATTGHSGPLDVRLELSAPVALAHGPRA